MARFTAAALERCFTGKLRGTVGEGGKHRKYEFWDDSGRFVASTVMSRGWKGTETIGPAMVRAFRDDLLLQGKAAAFERLVRCPLSREDWLQLVR